MSNTIEAYGYFAEKMTELSQARARIAELEALLREAAEYVWPEPDNDFLDRIYKAIKP